MKSLFRIAALLCLWGISARAGHAAEKLVPLRGAAVRVAWDKPTQPHLEGIPVRDALSAICDGQRLAWMLDRRLNPDSIIHYTAGRVSLSEVLNRSLEPIESQAILLGDTIIVGPMRYVRGLRTLTERQRIELQQFGLPVAKVSELSRQVTWTWDDLTEPREIIRRGIERTSWKLDGLDQVPYDLWGRGALVGMTTGEAMTVILSQYDLQLRWTQNGTALVVPIEGPVEISRTLPNFSQDTQTASEQFPDLQWEQKGSEVRVRGRVEDIDALEKWLKGTARDRTDQTPPKGNWRTRKFTLQVENAPLVDFLNQLKKQGVPVEWDESELTRSGIDLRQKINISGKGVTAEMLIRDLCQQAHLKSDSNSTGIVIHP